MFRIQTYAMLSLCGALGACGPQMVWDRDATTEQQFLSDRYACLQQSQAMMGGGAANAYGAHYSAGPGTNEEMFNGCMLARGYRWVPRPSSPKA